VRKIVTIPKGMLKSVMQSSRILKPEEKTFPDDSKSELVSDNNSKLTFRKSSVEFIETSSKSIILPDLVMLSGSEKKAVISLCEKKEKYDNGKLITKPINIASMSKETEISIVTLKKSIQRLEKKGFIYRLTFKTGRDGWTIYSIPPSIYKGLMKDDTRQTKVD